MIDRFEIRLIVAGFSTYLVFRTVCLIVDIKNDLNYVFASDALIAILINSLYLSIINIFIHSSIMYINQLKLEALRSCSEIMYSLRSGNFYFTYCLINFEAHLRSASIITIYLRLQMSLMFLPENPYVCSASIFRFYSVKCLAYLLNIAALD